MLVFSSEIVEKCSSKKTYPTADLYNGAAFVQYNFSRRIARNSVERSCLNFITEVYTGINKNAQLQKVFLFGRQRGPLDKLAC